MHFRGTASTDGWTSLQELEVQVWTAGHALQGLEVQGWTGSLRLSSLSPGGQGRVLTPWGRGGSVYYEAMHRMSSHSCLVSFNYGPRCSAGFQDPAGVPDRRSQPNDEPDGPASVFPWPR